MYVEALAAGQSRDESVYCVGVTAAIRLDCVAVMRVILAEIGTLLVAIMVIGALSVSALVVDASLGGEQEIST